jgi:hypothetical protein
VREKKNGEIKQNSGRRNIPGVIATKTSVFYHFLKNTKVQDLINWG